LGKKDKEEKHFQNCPLLDQLGKNFFPFLIGAYRSLLCLVPICRSISVNCLGLGYENFQRRIPAVYLAFIGIKLRHKNQVIQNDVVLIFTEYNKQNVH